MGKSTISMAIFNSYGSYVSLPEGKTHNSSPEGAIPQGDEKNTKADEESMMRGHLW